MARWRDPSAALAAAVRWQQVDQGEAQEDGDFVSAGAGPANSSARMAAQGNGESPRRRQKATRRRGGEEEATKIIDIALNNLDAYLWEVKEYNNTGDVEKVAEAQDYYCTNQQKNPHTPMVMKSLGLPEEDVEIFCRDMLFPKLA